MAEINVTAATFEEEVLKSDKPVLVDFWATWCGPCKMVAPVLAEIAEEHADKIKVCKVNVDEEQPLAFQYKVSAIPTMIYFKDGEAVNTLVGCNPKEEIEKLFL